MRPPPVFFVLLLSASSLLADCPTPRLRLTPSTREPRQGAVVSVVLRSDAPLTAAALGGDDERIALESDGSGRVFRGLVGVDFEAKTGKHVFAAEATDSCGSAHHATLELRVRPGQFPSQRLKLEPKYVVNSPPPWSRITVPPEK